VSRPAAADGSLARYQVRARNTATGGGNPIHDDEEARRRGYRGGLVPGVTTWAYLCHPLTEVLGPAFVEGGSAKLRLVAPVYDGDDVEIDVSPMPMGEDEGAVEAVAQVAATGVVARAAAWIGTGHDETGPDETAQHETGRHDAGLEAAVPLPDDRPAADEMSLAPGRVLGTVPGVITKEDGLAYLATVGESLSFFEERGALHPGQLLQLANRALAANVALGPWVHVGSELTHRALVRWDEPFEVRSRVHDRFERRGHEFVTLDVTVNQKGEPSRRSGALEVACRVRHTAIYRLAPLTEA
jgi:acyl dehydratase